MFSLVSVSSLQLLDFVATKDEGDVNTQVERRPASRTSVDMLAQTQAKERMARGWLKGLALRHVFPPDLFAPRTQVSPLPER